MTSKDLGLISKYIVKRTDGKPISWCFVLEDKDPLAWPALLVYADMAEGAGYLQLATDLRAKVASFPRRAAAPKDGEQMSMDEMRSRHQRHPGVPLNATVNASPWCQACLQNWPCVASVVLSALDSEQRSHDPARLALLERVARKAQDWGLALTELRVTGINGVQVYLSTIEPLYAAVVAFAAHDAEAQHG